MQEPHWRILHVDDDEEDHFIVRSMLKEAKGRTLILDWAPTYQEGREKLLSNDYQAVLVDYDLGIGTGIELIREFVDRGYAAPMILLTGRGSYEVDVEAMHAGATLYLTKNEINALLLERSIRYAVERKQTETALRDREARLRASEERFQLASRAVTGVLYDLSLSRETLYQSEGLERVVGYRPGEEPGGSKDWWPRNIHPADYPRVQALLQAAIAGQDEFFGYEYRIRHKNGHWVHILDQGYIVRDGHGRAERVVGICTDISKSKQMEESLRLSEERYRLAARATKDAIWDWDLVSDTIEWNESMLEMFGYTADQMKTSGGWWKSRIHPDDCSRVVSSIEEVIHSDGFVWSSDYRFLRQDGSYAEVSDSGWVLREDSGEPVRMVGAMREVSGEKETERVLRENEANLRRLADAMPQLVWTAQPDGTVDYYNQRYRLYGGIEPTEDHRWEWAPVLYPDDLEPTIEAWHNALKTSNTYEIEHRVRMTDGSFRWHLSRGVPSFDEQGRLVKWYGTATDIHDFVEIQEMLRSREQRMHRLFESDLIGIVTRKSGGQILEANDAYLKISGYSREEIQSGKGSIREITPPEYRHLDTICEQEVTENGFCKPFEKEYLRKDGTRIPVLIGYSLYDNGELEFIGFVLDLSELKQAQAGLAEYAEKLKRSNEELENFAFIASHDLQEPLRKFNLFGNRLRQQLEGRLPEDAEDSLQRMQSASERMQAMVNGLLDLSRVNTRGGDFKPLDLTAVAKEAVSDLETRIRATGGQVVVEPLPRVEGDAIQLHQLFQNIIGNGLKFHKEGTAPRVRVSGRLIYEGMRPVAQIEVEDNGIGFDETTAEQIFQPFARLHSRSQYEGSGIGLAICRKITERHGGSITASSRPGEGSRFTVKLPAAPPSSGR